MSGGLNPALRRTALCVSFADIAPAGGSDRVVIQVGRAAYSLAFTAATTPSAVMPNFSYST